MYNKRQQKFEPLDDVITKEFKADLIAKFPAIK